MKRSLNVLAVCLLVFTSPVYAAGEEAGLGEGMVNPGYEDKPAWFKESFLDLGEDVAEAVAAGKQLILYFYQDGCPYCAKLLRENFADRDIVKSTRENFDLVAINMWGDREVTDLQGKTMTEKAFAAALRVQYTPTLLFVDGKGRLALRINGYYAPHRFQAALNYVAGGRAGKLKFTDYLARQSTGRAASGQLHDIPGALAAPLRLSEKSRKSGKLLMVVFEQAVCGACDELHGDVLKRESVRQSMAGLDIAQVDIASTAKLETPDGKTLPARDWARALGVQFTPSLVFFDSAGAEVFRTEGYLKTFHIHGAMDYVISGTYREQPNFQRFLQARTEALHAKGIEVDLMD